MPEFQARIRNKNDSEANWTTNNPTLLDGEICVDNDIRKIKIGNNATWNNTEYFDPIRCLVTDDTTDLPANINVGNNILLEIDDSVVDILPDEYQQVEYLESTGTQWILTNDTFTLINPYKLKIKFMKTDNSTSDKTTFGSTPQFKLVNTYKNYFEAMAKENKSGHYYYDMGSIIQNESTTVIVDSSLGYFQDDILINSTTNSSNYDVIAQPAIFASYNGTTAVRLFTGRIYFIEIYSSNNIIYNYIPCIRKSDSKPGMYDTVTGTFFTNQGSGEFLYGSAINNKYTGNIATPTILTPTVTRNNIPVEYQEVEYLESTGTQYIQTNAYVSKPSTNTYNLQTELFYTVSERNTNRQLMGWNGASGYFGINSNSYYEVGSAISTTIPSISSYDKIILKHEPNNVYLYINNDLSVSRNWNASGGAVRLFSIPYGDYVIYNCKCKIKYCILLDETDNTTLLNCIPAIRKSDSKPGMYDTVSNTFFTNQGTGEFLYGDPVTTYTIEDNNTSLTDYSLSSDLSVTISAFSSSNSSDTHVGTRYKITTDAKGVNTVYDSGIDRTNLLSKTISFTKTAGQKYYLWVKVYGSVLGESDWSVPRIISVTSSVQTPVLTSPIGLKKVSGNAITAVTNAFLPSSLTHVSSDWKITSDESGNNIIASLLTSTTDKTLHTFTNLSLTDGFTYYVWCKHNSTASSSMWGKTQFIKDYNVTGRSLYRHSSNLGTVLSFYDTRQRNILILDAQYRSYGKFAEANATTSLTNYTTTNSSSNSYVNGGTENTSPFNCMYVTDSTINSLWSSTIDTLTGKENDTSYLTYTSTTWTGINYCRTKTVNGNKCDVPNIQTLIRIYCDAEAIDALDPTITTYPQYALGAKNTSYSFWNIGNTGIAWSSTSNSSGVCTISKYGVVAGTDKSSTGFYIPILEL